METYDKAVITCPSYPLAVPYACLDRLRRASDLIEISRKWYQQRLLKAIR